METNYKKVEFFGDIDSAMKELSAYKERGELACVEFNGQTLYSDTDDLDSAYKKITGKTKAEFDEALKASQDEYAAEEKRHKEAIPQLTKEWTEKGRQMLDQKYFELWDRIVPARLDDLYRGMELGACLEIVKELNAGCELQKAKDIIESQGHSGMSFGLVCSMVRQLCDRGSDFVHYAR